MGKAQPSEAEMEEEGRAVGHTLPTLLPGSRLHVQPLQDLQDPALGFPA